MKRYLLYITCFFSYLTYAQVGIGTVDPQQELHIAGNSSTIRIESLDEVNSSNYNDGSKLVPVSVDGNGNLSLFGSSGIGVEPLSFLIDIPNFIADNPYNHNAPYNTTGIVINSDTNQTENVGVIGTAVLNVSNDMLLEVKYGVTTYVRGSDLSGTPPWQEPVSGESSQIGIYFCVDINSDGLSNMELNDRYGLKGLYYGSNSGGIAGHPYMNGQGFMEIPQGTHILYFFGTVKDHLSSYTSVGFGGAEDYLKIRIYE